MTVVAWFSCGAASAVAAKIAVEKHSASVVNIAVAEEHPDNHRFMRDVEQWLGVEILQATSGTTSADEVWRRRRFMSSPAGAPCTLEIKKAARYAYQAKHDVAWHVLGFTADERGRHERFIRSETDNVLPLLIDAGLTKGDCFRILSEAGIRLPEMYALGFPNANCIGCVKASSPTYWNHVRRVFPDVFRQRSELADELGAKLVRYRGERIPLSALPPNAKGAPMRDILFECGIFCTPETVRPKRRP